MIGILRDVYGFLEPEIRQLRDDHPRDRPELLPSKANMLRAFRWLVDGAGPGDSLFLHYSGHGGQQRDLTGDEEDGEDETLIPCDFQTAGQITDDELFDMLVRDLP